LYQHNLKQHKFVTEKEKYAQYLERQQLSIDDSMVAVQTLGRRIPLGHLVTQMEMRNPDTREHLK
jgi:hypothetical protein